MVPPGEAQALVIAQNTFSIHPWAALGLLSDLKLPTPNERLQILQKHTYQNTSLPCRQTFWGGIKGADGEYFPKSVDRKTFLIDTNAGNRRKTQRVSEI